MPSRTVRSGLRPAQPGAFVPSLGRLLKEARGADSGVLCATRPLPGLSKASRDRPSPVGEVFPAHQLPPTRIDEARGRGRLRPIDNDAPPAI